MVMWNVFLFVICGGSLIYGFVQQRRITENRVQLKEYQQQIDSLKLEMEKMQEESETALNESQD